jgi:hypothetical protein
VLLDEELEEVDDRLVGPVEQLREAVLLLLGREVGREEEDRELAVVVQRVGDLAELLADLVDLVVRWSSSVRTLRVTFSVARIVRSATSLRISWIARRVSSAMSRLVWASSSSRRFLASAIVSCSLVSAALRARARIVSACSRAAASRSRYSPSSSSASARVRSAVWIDSSMRRWRRSSASAICGNAYFLRR